MAGRDFEDIRIGEPFQAAIGRGSEIDCQLTTPDGDNNFVIQICVGLKPDDQRCGSLILARARCSFCQSAGFASANPCSGHVIASVALFDVFAVHRCFLIRLYGTIGFSPRGISPPMAHSHLRQPFGNSRNMVRQLEAVVVAGASTCDGHNRRQRASGGGRDQSQICRAGLARGTRPRVHRAMGCARCRHSRLPRTECRSRAR